MTHSARSRSELRGEIHRPDGRRPSGRWLSALAEIERLCFPPAIAYSPATLALWLMEPSLLVTGLWRDEHLAAAQLSDLSEGHLITLDVHPGWRRRGLGRRLLRATLHLQRRWGNRREVICEIATGNEPSLRLHEQESFEIIGSIRGYYEDGTDALVLRCRLRTPDANRPGGAPTGPLRSDDE